MGKTVHFSQSVQVYWIHDWLQAHKMARNGQCWIQLAIDRCRFQRQVNDLSLSLGPVLSTNHRQRIYNERFRDMECVECEA